MAGRWLAGLLTGLLLSVAAASPVAAAPLSAQDEADVARVNEYLNAIQTLEADFIQAGSDGQLAKGKLYLRRPGRLRFQYAPPSPLLLVGDGLWLILYDRQLDQVSRWPIGDTPLGALVERQVDLNKDTQVTEVRRKPGILGLTLVKRDKPEDGSVTVVFSDPPLMLRQWHIVDPQGTTVDVALSNLRLNVRLDPGLFVFDQPVDTAQ